MTPSTGVALRGYVLFVLASTNNSQVMEVLRAQITDEGIAPIFINPANGAFVASDIRLGSRGDSYYEYLLKCVQSTHVF
jgi:hypothetical protein